jgi:glycerol-3-phosphate cytidylyltransferase
MLEKIVRCNKKIVSIEELVKVIEFLKAKNKKIVFTNGCFDILHAGHMKLLNEAKSFGDILIVGLNSDGSVKRIKGDSRPINSQERRAEALSGIGCIDYVVIFEENTPCEIISQIKPDIHVKGGDYDSHNYAKMPEAEIVHKYGGEVKIVKLVEGQSTTAIINKMAKEKGF